MGRKENEGVGYVKAMIRGSLYDTCWKSLMLLGTLGLSRAQLIPLSIKQRLWTCGLDRYVRREESGRSEAIRWSALEFFDAARLAQPTGHARLSRHRSDKPFKREEGTRAEESGPVPRSIEGWEEGHRCFYIYSCLYR